MSLEEFLAFIAPFVKWLFAAGLVWFALGLACIVAVSVFAIWAFRQQDKDYQRMKAEAEARRAEMEQKWRGR